MEIKSFGWSLFHSRLFKLPGLHAIDKYTYMKVMELFCLVTFSLVLKLIFSENATIFEKKYVKKNGRFFRMFWPSHKKIDFKNSHLAYKIKFVLKISVK